MTLRIKIFLCAFWASLLFCLPISSFSDEQAPSETEKKQQNAPQTSYVYDLKSLIVKSKDNIKRVNEKIKEQAIYRRNQLREEKAREYYDRAMELTEEGKVEEAQEFFEKSIRISEHPEMKDYVRLSEKRFKSQAKAMRKEEQEKYDLSAAQERQRQQQVREAYDQGVVYFKRKKYREARDQFMLVEQVTPGFKATLSYLKLSEDGIASQELDEKVAQKKEIVRQQKDAEAARVREKEMWHKELELKEKERQRKLKEQAAEVYAQAVKFYNEKNFLSAKEKFQEVEWVIPDYKSTRKYLEKLDRDIKDHEQVIIAKTEGIRAKREWEDELLRKKLEIERKKEFQRRSLEEKQKAAQEAAIHYQKAKELMVQKKYSDARDAFLAVEKIYPDYMATSTHLARLNKTLGIIETAPEKVEEEVKVIYREAVDAYEQKDLPTAKSKFERVEFMYPDYQSTRKYLNKLVEIQVVETQGEVASGETAGTPPKVGLEVNKLANNPLVEKVEPLYVQAQTLFDEKKYQEALTQFEAVESILPNYKSTRPFIKRVNHQIKKSEKERYKAEQLEQAEIINVLAKQASVLYQKISQLTGDRGISGAQKKFAMVDKLFANMSKEQARLLLEIAEEEEKLRLEEIAYEQEMQRSEFVNAIDPVYQEAVRLYQAKKYDEAKAKFLEAQSKIADYRSSKRYLNLIDKQNQLLQETMRVRESQIAEYQDKAAQSAEMAAQMQIKAQENSMIQELVASAGRINDEIVALSKERNFEAIKEKFAELEKIVDSLLTIQSVAAKRDQKGPTKHRTEIRQDKTAAERSGQTSAEEPAKATQPTQASLNEEEQKMRRNAIDAQKSARPRSSAERRVKKKNTVTHLKKLQQVDRDNGSIYKQALQSYAAGNYSDAKSRFLSLEHNIKYGRAARKYIDKIDRMILHKQNLEIERLNRKRTGYIESRGQRDKMMFKVQEAMRDNRLQRSLEPRFTSPILNPSMRYSVSGRDYADTLNLNLRQRPTQAVPDQEQVSQMKAVPSYEEEKQEQEVPQGVHSTTSNDDGLEVQRQSQKRFSDPNKKSVESKAVAEQKKKEAVLPKVVSKRLTEADRLSQKQLSQEKKLRKLYEQELRRSKGPGGFDNAIAALELENKAKNDIVPEWKKTSLRQQREEERSLREDKEREISNRINRDQSLKGADLRVSSKPGGTSSKAVSDKSSAESGQQGPSINPNDQESLRRTFEDGLAKMYADALKDYRNHAYREAREKFNGIEEIAPNYKRTRTYMERIDGELIREQQRREKLRDGVRYQSSDKVNLQAVDAPAADPAKSSGQRLDVISNALDAFETTQK